jgi:hypothetical protein
MSLREWKTNYLVGKTLKRKNRMKTFFTGIPMIGNINGDDMKTPHIFLKESHGRARLYSVPAKRAAH